jgi:hypothetical protein
MSRIASFGLAALLALSVTTNAFGWGSVSGPRGGAAYRGPMGGGAARGPNGGTAVRGPYGGAAARGPNGGAAVRSPYGGAAAVGPNGGVAVRGAIYRPYVRAPYYGAVVAGVALGTVIVASAPPPVPAPGLCWFWSNPAGTQGYWDYCS